MIRRILVIGSIALAVAGGARFALLELREELLERRWERRKEHLLEMAVFLPKDRRPWEVRFESLAQRVASSPRMEEILRSPYRPDVCLGDGEPRPLDDFERVWVMSIGDELTGLDGVLTELRRLPLDELEWHGEGQKLGTLREITNALCARAWLAAEQGDSAGAAEAYADALRLARATTDGSRSATSIRYACDGTTLRSLRSVLRLGVSPSTLREAIVPLLEDWAYAPERAEHVIRRELSVLEDIEAVGAGEFDLQPVHALRWLEPVEQALELTKRPIEAVARLHEDHAHRSGGEEANEFLWYQSVPVSQLHALHAQRNVALTALAVAAFRERHGQWPAALAELELAPEHVLDPLAGSPLPYSLTDSGARVGPAAWGTRVDVHDDVADSLYVWTLR